MPALSSAERVRLVLRVLLPPLGLRVENFASTPVSMGMSAPEVGWRTRETLYSRVPTVAMLPLLVTLREIVSAALDPTTMVAGILEAVRMSEKLVKPAVAVRVNGRMTRVLL